MCDTHTLSFFVQPIFFKWCRGTSFISTKYYLLNITNHSYGTRVSDRLSLLVHYRLLFNFLEYVSQCGKWTPFLKIILPISLLKFWIQKCSACWLLASNLKANEILILVEQESAGKLPRATNPLVWGNSKIKGILIFQCHKKIYFT